MSQERKRRKKRAIAAVTNFIPRNNPVVTLELLPQLYPPWADLSLASDFLMATSSRFSNDASRFFVLKYRLEPTE